MYEDPYGDRFYAEEPEYREPPRRRRKVRRGAGAAQGSQGGAPANLVRTGGDSLSFAALALALIMAGGTMLRARTRPDPQTHS